MRPSAHVFPAFVIAATLALSAPAGATLPNGFFEEIVGAGLEAPVGFAILPGGRALVAEHYTAKIKLVESHSVRTVVQIPNVAILGERGLQGIAVDPEWPARPYVFLHYTSLSPSSVRVSRFRASGDLDGSGFTPLEIDTASRYDILSDIPDNTNVHQGGALRFDRDRRLYVSIGDDNNSCDAQDLATLGGKILRIEVRNLPDGPGGPPPRADLVATGNPFDDSPDVNTRLIWAYGLRNPFRFAIDSMNDDLYVGDVGASTYEEINFAGPGGLNFGWPWVEGTTPWLTCASSPETFMAPSFGYDHRAEGPSAIIAGALYRRPSGDHPFAWPPEYEGDFFFCDFFTGEMVRMTRQGDLWQVAPPEPGQPSPEVWGNGFRNVTDIQLGPEGGMWYTARNAGQLRRITYIPGAVEVPVVHAPQVPTPLFFDIQGRRVDAPTARGIYFMRLGEDGNTKKVILK